MRNLISTMSKFEKIFWVVISVFMLIFIVFSIIASLQPSNPIPKPKEPTPIITYKYIQENLDKHKEEIIRDQNIQLEKINDNINSKIDELFVEVEDNVDVFLDFHYSVIGEYVQLGVMAVGDIGEIIQEKLFGENFESKVIETSKLIHNEYNTILKDHLNKIQELGFDGVDTKLNSDILKTLHSDIIQNEITQGGKFGLLVASRLIPRLVQSISTKLAGKAIIKVVAKTSAKLAAATTGVAVGTLCGPFVWVCAPIAAGVAWIATDVAIVYTMEALNRDDFKKEILQSIKNAKQESKNEYITTYSISFNNSSEQIVEKYGMTQVKIIERITGNSH